MAGEHCDAETARWSREAFGQVPVLDNWWQTETGWAITCHNVGLGNRTDPPEGSTGLPVPGYDGVYSFTCSIDSSVSVDDLCCLVLAVY